MSVQSGLLILGASSRIGFFLHHLWAQGALDFGTPPIWQFRPKTHIKRQRLVPDNHIIWDMLHDPMPPVSPTGVICLAGPTLGPNWDDTAALAQVAAKAAHGAPLLYISSQAVYGAGPEILSECSPCNPQAYGAAKLAAEAILAKVSNATCLRVGNVVGADSLLTNAQYRPVTLDRFSDGRSPRRMMIGARTLGQALADLLTLDHIAEPVLNLAQPGLVAMSDLLLAAKQSWTWQNAPEHALPELRLDLRKVMNLIDLPQADPVDLIAQARQAGWSL